MNTLEFFQATLPAEGTYFLALFKPGNKAPAHKAFHSLEALAQAVQTLEKLNPQWTVYHACASYNSDFVEIDGKKKYRVKENWNKAKSFWCDIDCGEDKASEGKGYATKKEAATAIVNFCTKTGFPRPMFIDSGNGIHCYWPLSKAIPSEAWVRIASALKALFAHHGLLVDPSRTADFASILRPVGSFHKKAEPKEVVCKQLSVEHDPREFAALVKELVKDIPVQQPSKPAPVISQEALDANADLLSHVSPNASIPVSAIKVAERCHQVAEMRDMRGDVGYDHWRGVIGIVKYCVEGEELAQEWSNGYAGYSEQETHDKFESWNTAPATCEFFKSCNPTGCQGCKYNGKIKTPMVLGHIKKNYSLIEPSESCFNKNQHTTLQITFSDRNGIGRPLGTTKNVEAVLVHEGVSARYNQMTKELEVIVPGVSSVPDESSNSNQTAAIDLLIKHGVPHARATEQINAIAASNPYCPVRQMIESRSWDGISRFDSFMAQIETPHRQEAKFYFRKWLIQAIAAVYLPDGLAAAGMLALTGPQGIGKTQLIRLLASTVNDSFLEGATLDPSNKDSVMTIASHWIVELGELDATFRKSDLAQLKAFITRKLDKFRRPYAKKDSEFPRRSVFAGTVNDAEFLHDNTGNRRFWVVQANGIQINRSLDIQQLWAEAKTWYDAGETWHFSHQEQLSLNQHNSQFEVVDPVAEKIQMKFNFGDMTKTTWLTATRIAEISGIDRPGKSELTRVSSTVKSLNGNQFKRANGLRLLLVPEVHA